MIGEFVPQRETPKGIHASRRFEATVTIAISAIALALGDKLQATLLSCVTRRKPSFSRAASLSHGRRALVCDPAPPPAVELSADFFR